MNDKIAELSKQAADYVNSVYYRPVRSKTPGKIWEDGHIGWIEQFNEKFAELIVTECAHVALMSNGNNLHVFTLIKEHFGVE